MEAIIRITAGVEVQIENMKWSDFQKLYFQCIYVEQFRADMIAQSIGKVLDQLINGSE